MGLVLQLARGGTAAIAIGLLGKGLDFSTDGGSHRTVTYVAFYGLGALLVVAVIVLTVVIETRKHRAPPPAGTRRFTYADLAQIRAPAEEDQELSSARAFARQFAGWVKSQELEAPPDLSGIFDDAWHDEQAGKVADGLMTVEDYERVMAPVTKRREWERQMRAEYQREWRADVGRWFDWAKSAEKLLKEDMLALLHADNPQDLEGLYELAESLERLAGVREAIPLSDKIESLIEDGRKILDTISEPALETPPGNLEPDQKALEVAADFFERARQVLIQNHRPSLIPHLERGVNEQRRRTVGEWESTNAALHERAEKGEKLNAEKMRHWVSKSHKVAVATVEGTLYGLAEARKEVG